MSLVSIGSLSNFPNSIFIACELSGQYLKNSLLFTVPYKESDLKDKVKKINLRLNLPIICYDKGSMYSASRLCCLLLAAGYTDVKVLYGGLKACFVYNITLVDDIPESVPLTERTLLGFKEDFIISKEEFMHMNTKNIETIYANFMFKHVFNTFEELSTGNILSFLKEANVHILGVKNCIFYGELAPLLAIFACFVGVTEFSVVLVDFDCSEYGGHSSPSSLSNTVYVSLSDPCSEKSMCSVELEHYSSPISKKSDSNKNYEYPSPCRQCCSII